METRLRFVDHKGCLVLVQDYSNLRDEDEFVRLIRAAEHLVHEQPPNAARILVDLTNARYTPLISQVSREVVHSNAPFVRATALIGIAGLMPVVLRAISAFAGRELMLFSMRDEARDWLAQQ